MPTTPALSAYLGGVWNATPRSLQDIAMDAGLRGILDDREELIDAAVAAQKSLQGMKDCTVESFLFPTPLEGVDQQRAIRDIDGFYRRHGYQHIHGRTGNVYVRDGEALLVHIPPFDEGEKSVYMFSVLDLTYLLADF